MGYELLLYEKPEDGIARITLNRPEVLNALNIGLTREIYAAAAEAAEDPDVVVLVYRGAGRAFCSGRDFKESGELLTTDPAGLRAWRREFHGVGPQTWLFPKATIAQVHGYALGGGHNLAVSCDITVAAEDAIFGFPEVRQGILVGRRHVWNSLIGPKKTKEYLFTGRNFGADEALRIGLINQVVPREQLEETVMSLARDMVKIERRHPGFIRTNKFEINYRTADVWLHSTVNPQVSEFVAYQDEFIVHHAKAREEFYGEVASKGIHSALDSMHQGLSRGAQERRGTRGERSDKGRPPEEREKPKKRRVTR